jgi:hypothetical protein
MTGSRAYPEEKLWAPHKVGEYKKQRFVFTLYEADLAHNLLVPKQVFVTDIGSKKKKHETDEDE